MKSIPAIAAITVLTMVSGCASIPTPEERDGAFLMMSQADFAKGVSVVDDPLNPSIEISTKDAWRDYQFSFGPHEDQFLRGYKFRDTGNIALQGYVTSDRNGTWLRPMSVTFAHTLSTRDVDRISFDVRGCSRYGCMHREDMVFLFSPEELDEVISALEARSEALFVFRIQGQSGVDRDGQFHVNELKAFREAVRARF